MRDDGLGHHDEYDAMGWRVIVWGLVVGVQVAIVVLYPNPITIVSLVVDVCVWVLYLVLFLRDSRRL